MLVNRQLSTQIFLDIQKEDSNRLLDFLKCSECHELANEAVDTLCCRALFCSGCLKGQPCRCKKYPDICRGIPNLLARRMIDSLPWTCPSCHKETTMSEQTDHNLLCPSREHQCPAEGCPFRGLMNAFLSHLVDAHVDKILGHADRLFNETERPSHLARVPRRYDDDDDDDHMDYDEFEGNAERRMMAPSRANVTGKNYCGGRLNGPRCGCCNGQCGPGDGCNCIGCMRQDLLTFGVNSPRALVNRDGAISRISSQTGQFYCGRPVMNYDTESDGYCGPNKGNNCHACGTLDLQLQNRYAAFAVEWRAAHSEMRMGASSANLSRAHPPLEGLDRLRQAPARPTPQRHVLQVSPLSMRSRTNIANTGKNYCENRLNGPRCRCCDGQCGPENGCNCVDCMRLDLLTFGVNSPRTLVNREGAIATISSQTGLFYCGRPVMRYDRETNGHCGPNNGHNCHACGTLDVQLHDRYASIAAEWEDAESTTSGTLTSWT